MRKILNQGHDAEHAFQVTFLLLLRRVTSTQSPKLLGDRLCRIACSIAVRIKSRAVRRRKRQLVEILTKPVSSSRTRYEYRLTIHEESSRLPQNYRPLVLYNRENQTHEEASRPLEWPFRTVKLRLV